MSSFLMDILSMLAILTILFVVFVAIPLFFFVSLILFITAKVQNKKTPEIHPKSRINLLLTLLIVSTVILALTVTAIICMAVWFSQAIVFM